MSEEKYIRPSWDEYFMKIREAVSLRATCGRGRAGCVITKDNHILSTGYVGAPSGLPDCDEAGHLITKSTVENDDSGELHDHCVRTLHAEQNAIAYGARKGVSLEGASIYISMEPCPVCARLIIAAGIKRVVCEKKYPTAGYSREMLNKAGIDFTVLTDKVQEYEKE